MQQAKKMYDTLCGILKARDISFESDDQELRIGFGGRGEDLPMDFLLKVDAKREVVILYSTLPFKFDEDNIATGALGTLAINDDLPDGSFDLDIFSGRVCFRVTNTYRGSLISAEALDFMLEYSIFVVDKFNDKLYGLATGSMTPEQFIDAI